MASTHLSQSSTLRQAFIVGADRLGNIPDVLAEFGIQIKRHISGRQTSHQKHSQTLPNDISLLILLTDFLGHNVMKGFRAQAQRAGIEILACRRSVSDVRACLMRQQSCANDGKPKNCADCPNNNQKHKRSD